MVTLFLALSACALAQSQPPLPSGRESESSQPHGETDGTQQQPPGDPQGTEQSPLVVKMQPATKTDDEAANEKQQEEREAAAHWWTVASVIGAGVIGLLQLAVLGFQAYIAKRQNTVIEGQTAIMQLQERAASSSAIAAQKQTEHMLEGLAETRKATQAAVENAQAATASATTIKNTSRAQIGVPYNSWKAHFDQTAPPGQQLKISRDFHNAGSSMGFFGFVVFHQSLKVEDKWDPWDFSRDDTRWDMDACLLPGQSVPDSMFPFERAPQEEIDGIMAGRFAVWTFGRIEYRDIFGETHYTNFTSRYVHPLGFAFPLKKGYNDGD